VKISRIEIVINSGPNDIIRLFTDISDPWNENNILKWEILAPRNKGVAHVFNNIFPNLGYDPEIEVHDVKMRILKIPILLT